MKRISPLPVAAGLVVAGLVTALVAAGSGGASAAGKPSTAKPAAAFRQALAAKLGEQLHKPAADVLAAMKTANRARRAAAGKAGTTGTAGGATRRARRAARLNTQAKRLTARAHRLAAGGKARTGAANRAARRAQRAQTAARARAAWAAALAKPLNVSASDVTAALRALVAERLGSLVSQGWITTDRRDAELACFDDATKCQGVRPPGLALLRAGL
jgi:hypothetical protein